MLIILRPYLKTFGVMLVLALMACGVFLKYEREKVRSSWENSPIKVFKIHLREFLP